jgi:tRNA threonylcarbamoyladenosine biosynthesis protein TsaE
VAWTSSGVERRGPLVVAVEGDLGAGKTTLVQAICRGFGVTEHVTSPTFALVHRYDSGRAHVYHLDLYRLAGPADLTNLGWDDIMVEPALVLIEWPERAGDRLPEAVHLRLSHVADAPDVRRLQGAE